YPEARGNGQRPELRRPSDSVAQDEQNSESRRPETRMGLAKQTPTTAHARSSDDEVIRLEATLVNIPVLVRDRSGRYIPQLSRHDFNLYEDGVEQGIATFQGQAVALNVVLLLNMRT